MGSTESIDFCWYVLYYVCGRRKEMGGGVFEGKDKRYAERNEKKEKNTHNILV